MKKALITATPGGFLPQFELNNVKLLQEAGYEIHYGANLENHIYQWDQKALEDRHIDHYQQARLSESTGIS